MIKIECPHCQTGYAPERMGIQLTDAVVKFTSKCLVCLKVFEGQIDPVVYEPNTAARWLLRRKPSLTHTSTSHPR